MTLARRFLRFAAVGATGTLIQYATLWAGVEFLAAPAAVASGVGHALGSVVNYLLNYFFTFESGRSHAETASKFYTVVGVGWCINIGLMGLLVHRWGLNYWFAQFFATGVCLIWNFIGSKWWAFKHAEA